MILSYKNENRIYDFIDQEKHIEHKNVFTILIGKNGTGKSSILGSIIDSLINSEDRVVLSKIYKNPKLGLNEHVSGEPNLISEIDNIIAISTSPFDKFPIVKRKERIDYYSYMGLRDLVFLDIEYGYMFKIISSLIDSLLENKNQSKAISNVLDYLGYKNGIQIVFNLNQSKELLEQFLESRDIFEQDYFKTRSLLDLTFKRSLFIKDNGQIDNLKIHQLFREVRDFINSESGVYYSIHLNSEGLRFPNGPGIDINQLVYLIKLGLVILSDCALLTKDGKRFSLKRASSGEQCVLLGILGISSKIKDNSLICIEEPEICLHPQWQEKYIHLITNTFNNYKNCQFIIATHSPQIISNISKDNCFILNMETNKLIDASIFVNNSYDFQLASLFETPGFKNEYLSRIALNIFSKVSRNKYFDLDDLNNFNILERQSIFLDENDPVLDLYLSLKEMKSTYA